MTLAAFKPVTECRVDGSGLDERLELHVLVRAYCAAWVALHSGKPTGKHRLDQLGVELNFGEPKKLPPVD
jgi:hypothetical protein